MPTVTPTVEINISLQRHVGLQRTRLGTFEVEHAQFRIFADAPGKPRVLIGYVGDHAGAPINFLRDPHSGRAWPEPVKQLVREAVARHFADNSTRRESEPPEPPASDPDSAEDSSE